MIGDVYTNRGLAAADDLQAFGAGNRLATYIAEGPANRRTKGLTNERETESEIRDSG